ncbi:YcaO-like family protein [Clostridium sp. DL1XJH146]
MYDLELMKFKDESPLNTINRIRNILGNLNILTKEENWKNSVRGFHSVTVRIIGTDISSNGKGTTSEYALASGYGELMERLQNMTYFRFSYDMSSEDYKYCGFFYSPDEKHFTIDEMYANNEWLQFYKEKNNSKFYEVAQIWREVSYEKVHKDFIAIPYKNIKTGKISYIPIKMACKMYMSNGMCAGNSREEALVQGICEIFERKVNKEVVLNKINPPEISREYLKKFTSIYNKIKRIESIGSYKIIIKDCSLGYDYPVVSVTLIDYSKGQYFVKFGAHPVIETALDRTLNELLQGQEITNMMGMSEFFYNEKITKVKDNMIRILENGCGVYPDDFFSENYSYKFNDIKKRKFSSNKEILKYLIHLINILGYKILVRDVSFLNFPAYHIIIPGLSDVDDFYDVESIADYVQYNQIKRFIRKGNKLSEEEIRKLILILNENKFGVGGSVTTLLSIPIKKDFPWYYTNIALYKACLFYEIKEYYKAGQEVEKFLSYMETIGFDRVDNIFFKCLRDCLFMKDEKIASEEVKKRLSFFYPIYIVDTIINLTYDKKRLLGYYGSINCFDCKNCSLKNSCKHSKTVSIYRILKSAMV